MFMSYFPRFIGSAFNNVLVNTDSKGISKFICQYKDTTLERTFTMTYANVNVNLIFR